MIRRKEECNVDLREAMRGGPGTVKVTGLASKEELLNHGRLYAEMVLEPNCGVGYHEHSGETEIFYLIEGTVMYNDNGKEIELYAGDVMICEDGSGHAITNKSDTTARLMALIITK